MVYMDTGCILNVIHVEATKMKREFIDGFYRGDILEGMMNGQNTLYFITLHDSADERSGGWVVSWITSWWKEKIESAWGGLPLKKLVPEDWFEMHTQDMPRIWTTPPAEMKMVVELFNEDSLTHPHIPHVFYIPCFMTYLWIKQLYNDTDVLFIVNLGTSFGPALCMDL